MSGGNLYICLSSFSLCLETLGLVVGTTFVFFLKKLFLLQKLVRPFVRFYFRGKHFS